MKTAVILHALFSEFTYEQMEAIFSLAKEHNGKFRIVPTGIQIYDITKEQKESILEHLPDGVVQVQHKSVNSIVACRGTDGCSHAFMETIPMATMVDQKHYGKDMPNKIRIGISGCPRCCGKTKWLYLSSRWHKRCLASKSNYLARRIIPRRSRTENLGAFRMV